MEAINGSLLLNIALVLAISTAQRIFAISSSRDKTPATVSQDYLLGEAHLVRKQNISKLPLQNGEKLICLFSLRKTQRTPLSQHIRTGDKRRPF